MSTDAQLVRVWATGNQSAGYELYKRHSGAVVRFFRNKVADNDLDDMLQSTFMKCFEHSDRYREDASFRAFVLGFARNLLLHHYRSWARKGQKLDFGVTSVRELGITPSGFVAAQQDEQRLLAALRELPIEHQTLLELFYWENMQGAELGQLYGVAEGTIRTRLRRARQLLLEAMQAETSPRPGLDPSGLETWARGIRAQFTEPKTRGQAS